MLPMRGLVRSRCRRSPSVHRFRAEPLHRLGGDCPHDPSAEEVVDYDFD